MAPPGGVVEHSTDKEMIKLSVGQTIAVTFSLRMNKKRFSFVSVRLMKSGCTRTINGIMFFLSMENVFYLGSKIKRQESREHFGTNKVHC